MPIRYQRSLESLYVVDNRSPHLEEHANTIGEGFRSLALCLLSLGPRAPDGGGGYCGVGLFFQGDRLLYIPLGMISAKYWTSKGEEVETRKEAKK